MNKPTQDRDELFSPNGNPETRVATGSSPTDSARLPATADGAADTNNEVSDFTPTTFEEVTATTDTPPDPFDPASLRLSLDFGAAVGVKKALLSVPVRKPDKSWFVRAHPDPAYRLQTAVVELKEDREVYLVMPALWRDLATETTFRPKLLTTTINRQGVVFLWEVNLPRPDGRADEWSRTALEALDMAGKQWVRVVANMSLGGYEVFTATGNFGEPTWPDLPFKELLRIAFKDRLITDFSHPVLRRLRGEV